MGKYIVKRLFAMALTLFIIITISFFAIRLIPGDVLGEGANPELRAAMRARYHLDKPLAEQYAIFLRNFISFDFGESITLYPRRPVFEIMAEKSTKRAQASLFFPFFSGKAEKKGPSETMGSCKFAAASQSASLTAPLRGEPFI